MRFTFVILLFCCFGADAQMIIKAHANYIPLNIETGINASFSIRKVVSGYSGSAIRVRRSNDNTEQDIGWVGTELDTASLKTFVGANSGFVTTWYNQNGGNNATQSTAANQPRIVNAGTVERLSGKVTLFFDGINDNMYVSSFNNTKVSAFVVFARQTGISLGRTILRKGRTSNTSFEFVLRTDASNYLEGGASTGASSTSSNTNPNTINATAINLGVLLFNNSTVRSSINSNAYVSNNLSGNMFQGTANIAMGSGCANEACTTGELFWAGRISEVLVYGTTVNDVTIKNNINSYYNLFWDGTFASILDTFPSSAAAYSLRNLSSTYKGALIRVRRSNDNAEQDIFGDYYGNLDTAGLKEFVGANNGFVTTWYDQSTNARNATQTTAANQPRIINAGTVERIAGEPSIFFDGSNDFFAANGVSGDITGEDKPFSNYSVVNKTNTNTQGNVISLGRTTDANPFIQVSLNATAAFSYSIRDNNGTLVTRGASGISYSANTNYLFTTITTGTAVNFYVNSTDRTPVTNSANVATLTLNTFTIGVLQRNTLANYYGGYISEDIIYASDNSSNRTGIETNINNYYGIY